MALWNGIRFHCGQKKSPYHCSHLSSDCWNVLSQSHRTVRKRALGQLQLCQLFQSASSSQLFSGSLKNSPKPLRASSLRKQAMSFEERWRIETVLCWVLSSKRQLFPLCDRLEETGHHLLMSSGRSRRDTCFIQGDSQLLSSVCFLWHIINEQKPNPAWPGPFSQY